MSNGKNDHHPPHQGGVGDEAKMIVHAIDNMSERVTALQGEIHEDADKTGGIVKTAVAEGIKEALCDKVAVAKFWDGMFDQIQERSVKQAEHHCF